jgi:hypothetical protein
VLNGKSGFPGLLIADATGVRWVQASNHSIVTLTGPKGAKLDLDVLALAHKDDLVWVFDAKSQQVRIACTAFPTLRCVALRCAALQCVRRLCALTRTLPVP